MNIKKEVQAEGLKLKNMSNRDRIWYIWEYYKFHMLAAALVILVITVICNSLYRQSFTSRLSIAIINDQSGGVSSTEQLQTALHQSLDYGKKDVIEINEGIYISFDEQSMSQYNYASLAKITAMIASNGLDIIIADQDTIEHYAANSAFASLTELLPADLYKQLGSAIFLAPDESGSSVPCAISLENTSFGTQTGIVMNPPYLAVVGNSLHTEAVLHTIRYLFDLLP